MKRREERKLYMSLIQLTNNDIATSSIMHVSIRKEDQCRNGILRERYMYVYMFYVRTYI